MGPDTTGQSGSCQCNRSRARSVSTNSGHSLRVIHRRHLPSGQDQVTALAPCDLNRSRPGRRPNRRGLGDRWWRAWGLSSGLGNEDGGHVAEFGVGVLGHPAQDSEGVVGIAAQLPHQNPQSLVDGGTRGHRGAQILGELTLVGQSGGDRDRGGGLIGVGVGVGAFVSGESPWRVAVNVDDANGGAIGDDGCGQGGTQA